jgi:hypothetical protein
MTKLAFTAPLQSIVIEEGYAPMGYLRLTDAAAEAIAGHELERRLEAGKRRGFGSVKVEVRIGGSRWKTSLFPRKGGPEGDGGWFLPVKKPVRIAEGLIEGDAVEVELILL